MNFWHTRWDTSASHLILLKTPNFQPHVRKEDMATGSVAFSLLQKKSLDVCNEDLLTLTPSLVTKALEWLQGAWRRLQQQLAQKEQLQLCPYILLTTLTPT